MSDPVGYLPVAPGSQPPLDSPGYGSTHKRHPKQAPIRIAPTLTESLAPRMLERDYPAFTDMSVHEGRQAQGERIIVGGRVLDENGRPVPHCMVEIWQACSTGRYHHPLDTHDAPMDPNFKGEGRVFTDADGNYQFVSIKPGAYPWRNHRNAWRPNHIHYSLFGAGFAQRLVTQMYFPGDPLLALDPVFNATPDAAARDRLVCALDMDIGKEEWALGYRFDFVLRGRDATPMENPQ